MERFPIAVSDGFAAPQRLLDFLNRLGGGIADQRALVVEQFLQLGQGARRGAAELA
jgi:hypothetical protein